jgi:hypothetical protein
MATTSKPSATSPPDRARGRRAAGSGAHGCG